MLRRIAPVLLAGLCAACSINQLAVNKLGNALAGSGTTFAADNDPEFIAAAAPFSLKLMESLLDASPRHRGLLLAATSGFTQYGYAFVQQEADRLDATDVAAAAAARTRARHLYLRARDYGLRGLEVRRPGIVPRLRAADRAALAATTREDVPLLYWTAAAWGAAIGISKEIPSIVADMPLMEALIDRALALDSSFEFGAIHAFLITYEQSRPGGTAGANERSRHHFERAVELSGGGQAGPFVSFAEAVAIPQQNRALFDSLVTRALAIDVDARPEWRLANIILQRRARWLRSRADELFL